VTRKALTLVAWLAAGHALLVALFWGLVNVPDANALMLGASLAVALLLLLGVALVDGTAAAWLLPGRTFREALGAGLRSVPGVVAALIAFGACWWLAGRLDAWHATYHGQIDAWMISRFNAPEATWPHRAIDILSFLLRDVLGVSLAVALLFAWLERGLRGLAGAGWLRAGLSRDQVMLVAIGVTLFIALPWHFAHWRPESLPPTWVQPAFAVAKLGLIYVAMNVGWALCLLAGARGSGGGAA
jgi:hypothetical protein